jgi:hypothetical protein
MTDPDMLDGCDLDFTADPTTNVEADLLPLFAEALDPTSDKTVDEEAARWRALFGQGNWHA